MSVSQFDAVLAILEPHIKKKTTNFCELSVQGSVQCFVLRDEVDELDNRHFWSLSFACTVCSELSKHLSKCFATDVKNTENQTWSKFFLWRRPKVSEAVCRRDSHSNWHLKQQKNQNPNDTDQQINIVNNRIKNNRSFLCFCHKIRFISITSGVHIF